MKPASGFCNPLFLTKNISTIIIMTKIKGRSNSSRPRSNRKGEMIAAIPIGTRVSRVVLPMMLPMERRVFFLRIADIDIESSGRLVPSPMTSREMTS